jgi:hypothetical protein
VNFRGSPIVLGLFCCGKLWDRDTLVASVESFLIPGETAFAPILIAEAHKVAAGADGGYEDHGLSSKMSRP